MLERDKEIAQRIYGAIEQTGSMLTSLENDELLEMGVSLWPHTYKNTDSDIEASDLFLEAIRQGTIKGAETLSLIFNLPSEQCFIMWAARWVDQGCPRVVFDAKYITLLMSTDVGKELIDKVVIPWKAFLIEMPENFLKIRDKQKELQDIRKILVQSMMPPGGKELLNIIASTNNGTQLWRHGLPIASLATQRVTKEDLWGYGVKCDSRDNRVMNLIGRLIISMSVAMSDPDNYHRQKRTKGRGSYRQSNKWVPEIQTFVLGRPVQINCRQAVLDYVEGSRSQKESVVRFLVRGHWRHQPYGPKQAHRKLIHVQPYWKGEADAPILTRDYLIRPTQ